MKYNNLGWSDVKVSEVSMGLLHNFIEYNAVVVQTASRVNSL